jgi:hypothetical protein
MFCVQVLERIGPIMLDYGNGNICIHDHEGCETYYHDGFDKERFQELARLHNENTLSEDYSVSGYTEKWITVQTCFTEDGCQRYLDRNRHNLRGYHGVRIYADSFNRNVEMLEIREFLISQPATTKTP